MMTAGTVGLTIVCWLAAIPGRVLVAAHASGAKAGDGPRVLAKADVANAFTEGRQHLALQGVDALLLRVGLPRAPVGALDLVVQTVLDRHTAPFAVLGSVAPS